MWRAKIVEAFGFKQSSIQIITFISTHPRPRSARSPALYSVWEGGSGLRNFVRLFLEASQTIDVSTLQTVGFLAVKFLTIRIEALEEVIFPNDKTSSVDLGKIEREFVSLTTKKFMPSKPNIPENFLWEYDLETFNYDKSYKIVIERVLERGNLLEWREILNYYGEEKILNTIDWSAQLDQRGKDFSRFFLKSDFIRAV